MHPEQTITRERRTKKLSRSGTTLCIAAVLAMAIMIFNFPWFVADAIYGIFGWYSYALIILTFMGGLALRFQKRFKISKRYMILGGLILFALFSSVHLAFTHKQLTNNIGFAKYLVYGFNSAHRTPGGIVFALPMYIIFSVCQLEGSFIVLAALFIMCSAFIATHIVITVGETAAVARVENTFELETPKAKPAAAPADYKTKTKELQAAIDAKYQKILQEQSHKRLEAAKSELGLTKPPAQQFTKAIYDNPIPLEGLQPESTATATEQITQWSTEAANKLNQGLYQNQGIDVPDFLPYPSTNNNGGGNWQQQNNNNGSNWQQQSNNFPQFQQPINNNSWQQQQPQPSVNAVYQQQTNSDFSNRPDNLYNQMPYNNDSTVTAPDESGVSDIRINRRLERARERMSRGSIDDRINARGTEQRDQPKGEQIKMEVEQRKQPKTYRPRRYVKPTIDLIRTESSNLSEFHIEAQEKQKLLDVKLKEFGVNAKVGSFTVAPAVTRFEIQLSTGTRVAQVEQLSKDISYVLGSTQIRLEQIEGKNAIGVEVPNKSVGLVSIKDILAAREFTGHKSPLAIAVGKNINDEIVIGDISTMPHLLIAGSTGSGKSVCLNTLLTSLLFRAHPDEVKLLLVDMKRVELNVYNEIPHMLIPRAIKDLQQVINALKWMEVEMRRRYDILESNGVNNIGLYHSLPAYQNGTLERMPYIVMVIDEAADLLTRGKKDVEASIQSLSALARACGIHIILATQRPSVDIITSVIKTNFTVRIAFKVSSRGDSVTIINDSGAEKLVGRGDMLYVKEGKSQRVQCAYIEMEETRKVMNFIRENNEAEFDPELEDIILNGMPADNSAAAGFGDADGIRNAGGRGQDPIFIQVLKWLVRDDNTTQTASISGLQRHFGIGFARAGKIIDQLAEAGYVSKASGTKTRTVLVSRDEVENIFGE